MSRTISNQTGDPFQQQEQDDKLHQEKHKVDISSTEMYRARGDSSKNEKKSKGVKKTRKRHAETIPRENSLIW